jgi:hypothetical protein
MSCNKGMAEALSFKVRYTLASIPFAAQVVALPAVMAVI